MDIDQPKYRDSFQFYNKQFEINAENTWGWDDGLENIPS
jgi:hypothetical protein